jgi:hypothetical protein
MEDSPQKFQQAYKPNIRQAIRPIAFAAIASGIVVFLLSPGGPVSRGLGLDLSFLIAAFVGYYVFRLISKLCSIFLPSYYGAAASCVFTGLAFSFFFYQLLGKAMYFTHLAALEGLGWFFSTLRDTTGYVILFIGGLVLSKLAGIFSESPWGWKAYPPANALGQLLVGLGMWQFFACFADSWEAMSRIGLILFAGMLAVSLSNIGSYGERSENPFISDASRWIRQSPPAKFILGALITTYIVFVHPVIVEAFRYTPLIEWGLVCVAAWRLFDGIKSRLATSHAVLLQDADWRKHLQQIGNRHDMDFIHRGSIQRDFATHGDRDGLLICLTLLLNENGLSVAEMGRILHPLINHQDAKMPWFAFGWEQQRVLRRNERERRRVLDEIMIDLADIANPIDRNTKEAEDEANELG